MENRPTSRLSTVLLKCLVTASLIAPAIAEAQIRPYVVHVANEGYQPLPHAGGTATPIAISGDEARTTVALPFGVKFFEQNYTEVLIDTNGFARLGTASGGSNFTNAAIPSSATPNGLIAVWWDDQNCPAGGVTSQTLGATPNRQFVVQWHCNRHSNAAATFQAQLWFTENSTTIKTKYGAVGATTNAFSASIGIENLTGTVGYSPLTCGANCTEAHWLANKAVSYNQGPDLEVTSVRGPATSYAGVMGHFEADVQNAGGQDARNFGLRFWVSRDNRLSADDALVGTAMPLTRDAAAGQTVGFTLDAPLPSGLAPGAYYLLAEADPLQAVVEDVETNNVAAFPFTIGMPAPDLTVESISAPAAAMRGSTFSLDWTARNLGNFPGTSVPYAVVLSSNDVITASDTRIFTGLVTVEALSTKRVLEAVLLPGDTAAGSYWIGIVIDPDNDVPELDDLNNVGVSDTSFSVSTGNLQITKTALPAGEVGSHYCVLLEAAGGDGTYQWSVEAGALPPGLSLLEERDGGAATLVTLLCGQPAQIGVFDFTLGVASGAGTTTGAFQLAVNRTGSPLAILGGQLQEAHFLQSYEQPLVAMGGKAPYSWRLAGGALPAGLRLDGKGVINGFAKTDGAHKFVVEVTDSLEATSRQELVLRVTSPSTLTCVGGTLPAGKLGETFEQTLSAAGGKQPYTWSTRASRRLPAQGDSGENFNDAPPGLSLSQDGRVSGKPLAAGSYLWTVEVRDGGNASDECTLAFEILFEQNITVLTTAIPDAFVGVPYRAQLKATGGVGELRWRVATGQRLPDGLSLSAGGEISGLLPASLLGIEKSQNFSFYVEVTDDSKRVNVLPLSVTLHHDVPKAEKQDTGGGDGGGCSTGAADPGLLACGAALGLAALRRRRRS